MARAGESPAPSASPVATGRQDHPIADPVDPHLADILRGVSDPELGLNIVDLGLVYAALRMPDGIRVVMTTTSPSCPMADMLVESVRSALAREFPDVTAIAVELALGPPWSPERISDEGRRELGWSKRTAAKTGASPSWTSRIFASFRRH